MYLEDPQEKLDNLYKFQQKNGKYKKCQMWKELGVKADVNDSFQRVHWEISRKKTLILQNRRLSLSDTSTSGNFSQEC